jgi:glycosyltransferase involved in cell wall biosynthesis
MRLVASLICRNELGRYLRECITSLQEFTDEIRVLDDASTDGSFEWLTEQERVEVLQFPVSRFFVHEGRARQALLEWTWQANPTHVASFDCDELISDGAALRATIGREPEQPIWSVTMCEVWGADEDGLRIREDSGWRSHEVPFVWRAPAKNENAWRIMDRKLACRRVPTQILRSSSRAVPTGQSLLHLGWTNPRERATRLARYREHDGGRFHANAHLDSIEFADDDPRLLLRERPWPTGSVFDGLRERFAAVTA